MKERNIFVEVESRNEVPKAELADAVDGTSWKNRIAIRRWLATLIAGVVLTILVGGATRLFDAGLAITEWKPISGALPPLSAADWNSEFEKYKQIPEFMLQNSQMTLAEFKGIYWLEWVHRQLGRVLGVIWLTGFLWFAVGRKLRPGWTSRLLVLGVLGGTQALLGWWMVQSGLIGTAVDVASYKLAVHLLMAFFISGLILWYILLLGHEPRDLFQARRNREPKLGLLSWILLSALTVQIALGALVSGIDAGAAFPTWPLMNGQLVPSDAFALTPLAVNFLENPSLVQFNHRIAAYLILAGVAVLWWKGRQSPYQTTRKASNLLAVATVAQAVLGVVTAVHGANPPTAILHQLGSIILFLLAVWFMFAGRYPVGRSVRSAR
ncbi:MAG: COX15/CtaA family protein [Rhodobacteraceae bacterium]|nr:COX15/CtaA family protein [Paracoccaceae bacterium]